MRLVNLAFALIAATIFALVVRVVAFVAPAAFVVLGVAQPLAGDQRRRSSFVCHAFGWWQGAYLALHRVQ